MGDFDATLQRGRDPGKGRIGAILTGPRDY
jgi:hypothetical protein